MTIDPATVRDALIAKGITCHHVSQLSGGAVLVFLEGNRSQHEQAEDVIYSTVGWAVKVTYPSPRTTAILRVTPVER